MNLFWCKANVKHFSFDNLHQDFDIMRIVHIAMDACRDNRGKYITKKNIKTYLSLHISLKPGGFFWSLKNPTFSNSIPRAKHILNIFELRTLNAALYLFHYIHFICSCYLDKHPWQCEQFSCYQSPDEGH